MVKMIMRRSAFGLLAALIGCRAYESSPVDWTAECETWLKAGELKFASLDDVARVAVVGNMELNRLRLKRATSEKAARATGWWDDPEADVDLLRVVNPTDNPIAGGVSLALTIPLSGVKGLERKTAEAYSAADAADIIAAERETAGAARSAAVRFLSAGETVRTLRAFESDPRIVSAWAAAKRLAEVGELSKTETASARLRQHQRLHRLREAENEAADAERTLRQLLGVAPSVKLNFERADLQTAGLNAGSASLRSDGALAVAEEPRNSLVALSPLDYVRHPRVQAALCRLEGGEAALETEIRRQYPDLKIGPAYSREEGLDRLGLVAGVTLPLWNRNRKGIAEAEGTRDEAKQEAVRIWREIVLAAAAARRTLERLRTHPAPPAHDVADADGLFDAGEISPLDYLVIREELLDGELAEITWRRALRLAEENLKGLVGF